MENRKKDLNELCDEIASLRSWAMGVVGNTSSSLRPQEIEDVVSQATLDAFVGLNEFRGESNLKTWFCRILVNATLGFMRKKSNHHSSSEDTKNGYDLGIPCWSTVRPNPEEAMIAKERLELVLKALRYLQGKEKKEAFYFFYFRDFSCKEVARATGANLKTTKVRIFRCRQEVQNQLGVPVGMPKRQRKPVITVKYLTKGAGAST